MKITIHHHLGLGDHFICHGLVRYIRAKYQPEKLHLVCKNSYYNTINHLYGDDSKIEIMPFQDDLADKACRESDEWKKADLTFSVGHEKVRFPDWDVGFYDQFKIPYVFRWWPYTFPRNKEVEAKLIRDLDIRGPFILKHEECSVGRLPIQTPTHIRVIEVKPLTSSVLDWMGVIELATEVHCIDSSFLSFAMSVSDNGIFHDIRSIKCGNIPPQLNPTWKIVKYE